MTYTSRHKYGIVYTVENFTKKYDVLRVYNVRVCLCVNVF